MDKIKVLTLVGTRPELIRLAVIISKLDKLTNHVFVYTNQNFTDNLSTIFFRELKIRQPDYVFSAQDSIGKFLGNAFIEFENVLNLEKPGKILILGDTNSGLISILADKYKIPIIHMESGNRCYDNRVPEETNRRVIDSLSTYNLPYTENSKQNLLSEGYHKNYVFKTGNPIYEVLNKYSVEIKSSIILDELNLKKQEFVLVTAHRAENVDNFESLNGIITALNIIAKKVMVVFSVHPRTKNKINKFNINISDNILMSEPFGFFDFIKLEKNSKTIISDCLHPDTTVVLRDGTIKKIAAITKNNTIVGPKTFEKVVIKESKKVIEKYKFTTKYNTICCSKNHRLFIQDGNTFIEKKAKDITMEDRIVSFCNIKVEGSLQELIKISTVDYVNVDTEGIEILRQKSLGDTLSQFGRFKSNTLYLRKGVSKPRLKKVLNYLNVDLKFLNKHTYVRKESERRRQITIKQPPVLDEKLAELIGFLCGDGYLVNSRVSLYDKNIENLKYFNEIFKDYFGISGKFKKDLKNKCIALNVWSKNLYNFIVTNFYTESQTTLTKKKDISEVICKSPDKVVAGYIRGLFEAEGFVGDHYFAITMSDKPVIKKLKYLLLRFGIITNLYRYEPRREKDKSVLYQLNIFEYRSRQLFKEKIGFISDYKNKNTDKLFDKIKKCKYHRPVNRYDNLFFDLIRKIEIVEDDKNYIDINVQPNNVFLANGLLSHNSGTTIEESCIFNVPSITIRNSTERQELIECGSTILTGTNTDKIVNTFNVLSDRKYKWTPPKDYLIENVSDTVINILLGKGE